MILFEDNGEILPFDAVEIFDVQLEITDNEPFLLERHLCIFTPEKKKIRRDDKIECDAERALRCLNLVRLTDGQDFMASAAF